MQNVGRIATKGLEAVYNGFDVGAKGLDVSGSITYADSRIKENIGFVSAPGDTLGKQLPNIPRWRATLLTSYPLHSASGRPCQARVTAARSTAR